MREKVLIFIKDNEIFTYGDRVLIGVSGGPDSIALMDFLNGIKKQFNLQLVVCHLNHMIRGVEADKDEFFVRNKCVELDIECYSKKIDIDKLSKQRKTSIEETGRDERYRFFYDIKEKRGIDKIALGHHKDDNVETIFMRFLRGTGIKGLRGIEAKRRDGVVRPFLCVSKSEMLEYCNARSLTSKFDQTNLHTEYHRNKLRIEVIPYMESLNPNFSSNLDNLGKICNGYYDFVQYHVKCAESEVVDRGKINVAKFNCLHEVLKTEMLIDLIHQVDSTRSVEFQHIKIILDKLEDQEATTWSVDLPKGIKMIRQYNYLFPEKSTILKVEEEYLYPCIADKVYIFPKLDITLKIEVFTNEACKNYNQTCNTAYFDYDKIMESGTQLNVRSRKKGDKIDPIGLNGTKKIKEIFIDKKIPTIIRWKIPLFCIDNEVIWIVGYHRSRKFTISKESKKILKIFYYNHKEEKCEK